MSMKRTGWSIASAIVALAILEMIPTGVAAQVVDPGPPPPNAVLTGHNDNARTGLLSVETILTPGNVNVTKFGKLYSASVDGYIYAQPLFIPKEVIPGNGTHDVVYVCTEHDSVYAFDAESGNQIWKTSFTTASGVTSVPNVDTGTGDIVPEIGITATPVINWNTQTMFVEAKTKEVVGNSTNYVHRLHALDVRTGKEKLNSPIVITAVVPGDGDGNDGNGHVPWNPLREHVRPALLLNNSIVYIASASHGDNGPYHGWVLAYEQTTLKQLAVLNLTPNGGLGGIWQAGAGIAADKLGNMFFATGNGTFTADPMYGSGIDYGDSFVKISPLSAGMKVQDFYTPFDQAFLDAVDGDLGSGGVLIPPTQTGKIPNILIGCGKEGRIYVVNRDNMNHFHASGDEAIQTISNANFGTWSSPAYFNNAIYYNGQGDVLKCYSLKGGLLSPAPIAQSKVGIGYPGATPSISSNGATNGIVWIIQSDAYGGNGPAVLHAFDAISLKELYNSSQAKAGRDTAGIAVKFSTPTVTTGKVFVGTGNQLNAYGPL